METQAETPDGEVLFHGAKDGLSVRVTDEKSVDCESFGVFFDPSLSQEQVEQLRATDIGARFYEDSWEEDIGEYNSAVIEGPDARHYAFAEMGWNGKSQTVGSMTVKVALGKKIYETLSKDN